MKKMLFAMFSLALVLTFTVASKPPKGTTPNPAGKKLCPYPPCPLVIK